MQSVINEERFENGFDKIRFYQNQEILLFQKIQTMFDEITASYKTDNQKKLENVIFTLKNKQHTIQQIHDNNLFVLEKNLNTYQDMKKQAEEKLEIKI